jgi:pimeloyl-ACP methyl ester carboxylesterase
VLSPRGIAKFIPLILEALDLDRVQAVGPDIGTSALLLSASREPDRIKSLVVSSGATDVATAAGRLKDIISAPSTSEFEGTDGAELAVGAVKRMMRVSPDPCVLQDYAESSAGRRFVEAMAYVRAYPADLPALHELLPSIRTPVLSIWGSQDPLVPLINAEILNGSLPNTRSLLLNSSHFVWEDQAEAYGTAIVEWINDGYRSHHSGGSKTIRDQTVYSVSALEEKATRHRALAAPFSFLPEFRTCLSLGATASRRSPIFQITSISIRAAGSGFRGTRQSVA